MKIGIVGLGYVGLSIGVLLARKHEVIALDINKIKIDMVNKGISTIKDDDLSLYLKSKDLNLVATTDVQMTYKSKDFIIIAIPSNYNNKTKALETNSIIEVINNIREVNSTAIIVIKSTVPIGLTNQLRKAFDTDNIIFSPEFLREGQALHDNLYPTRIIVGDKSKRGEKFAKLMQDAAIEKDVPILLVDSEEAESIKLFSNTYLALRVSYFNEIDTFAEEMGLDTRQIIDGVCMDPRIGAYYNNPSFGYGGYCLPKDVKQLVSNYSNVPNDVIKAVVASNETRKKYIIKQILRKNPKVVGIYRINAKKNSDNFRYSSVINILKSLKKHNVIVVIYEQLLTSDKFETCPVIQDLEKFKSISDLIIANRYSKELEDVLDKVYTRDIFFSD